MDKRKNRVIGTVLALLSLSLVLGAGYYKSSVNEAGSFNLSLPQQGTAKIKPVTVDLKGEGFLKKIIQPGLIQVNTHGIVNKTKKDITLQFELTDNSLPVMWNITDKAWDEKNHVLARSLKPGEQIAVGMLFNVPKELRSNPVIYKGNLKVLDYNSKEQLADVPINLINSNGVTSDNKDCCNP